MSVNDKFVVERPDHEEKEHHSPPNEPELVTLPWTSYLPEPPNAQTNDLQEVRPFWRKKRVWLPMITLVVVSAIIGGTLGGLRSRKDSLSQRAITSAPSTTNVLSTASTLSATLHPFLTSTPSATPAPFNSSLASVAWTDSDGIEYYRLYHQDSAGVIRESAWNSSTKSWYSSNEALGMAKPNSPLAASVAGPRFRGFQLNLHYLDTEGRIVELFTKDGQSWVRGGMSEEIIVPSADSNLAAIWAAYDGAPCNQCWGNGILLVYQDSNNELWVVNATGSGYDYAKLYADANPGSGLAMTVMWRGEGNPGLKLFYQKGMGIISADWEDWESGTGKWEWTLHENKPLGNGSAGARIGAFSWGSDTDPDQPQLADILSSGPQGVDISWWTPQGWQVAQRPYAMSNVQAYSALAANVDRHVYALEAGSVKEFVVSTDGLTWSLVGDVPIKT